MNEINYLFSLNNFFDHIYVITLKRAADRHQHFEKELKGLEYTVFFGKDKNEFNVKELSKAGIYDEQLAIKNDRYGKAMDSGPVGCSWSHQLVYQDIVKNGYKKALILEDDVVISNDAVALLPGILKELPADWELFYLGFDRNEQAPPIAGFKKIYYHLLSKLKLIKFSNKTINNLYPKKITEHIYKAGYHNCTHAYGITGGGAAKLLVLQTPICFVADHFLAYAATNEIVNAYITLPKIIDQLFQVSTSQQHSYLNE
jgi:glycosyl transferase, family 25